MIKKIILHTLLIITLLTSKSYGAVNNNNSSTSNQDNDINLVGYGLSIVKKIELIDGLISFDESDDNIFIMPEIFYESFFDNKDKIEEQYGLGFNFGYGYKDFDIFASLGGLRAKFEYEINNQIEDYHRGTFYYGFGIGYNFNKYLATKINTKFYKIEFTDRTGSSFHSRNSSVALSLSIKL